MSEKIWISKSLGRWTLEGPLDDVIKSITDAKKHWESIGYKDLEFEEDYDYHSCDCGASSSTIVRGKILETDKELEVRLKLEQDAEESKAYLAKRVEEQERLMFEKLQKKYGKPLASSETQRTYKADWADPTGS